MFSSTGSLVERALRGRRLPAEAAKEEAIVERETPPIPPSQSFGKALTFFSSKSTDIERPVLQK